MEKILIETSARHVHVTREQVDILFGEGYQLTPKKDLSQPGQFACAEKVEIVGPRGSLKASILGPERKAGQVEVSLSDARALGVTALVRESGVLAGTNGIKLVGPKGEVELSEGLIAAKRHIHLTPETAEDYGVQNGEIVQVKIEGNERSLIFDDVVVRVSPDYAPAMHIDTDEANAAGITCATYGQIIR